MPRTVQGVFLIQRPVERLFTVDRHFELLGRVIPLDLDNRPGRAPCLTHGKRLAIPQDPGFIPPTTGEADDVIALGEENDGILEIS
jgi:hypothetical protein